MFETNELVRKFTGENETLKPLSDQDIQDIQNVLIEMMDDFDAVCRKYKLTYILCGGTALGAVRHKGFIPWDEDVDLGMPRADYDRLEKLFLKEYGDKYFLQSLNNSEIYDLPFMKIRKKGTRFVEIFETEPEKAGIFMDIYPLENLPDGKLVRLMDGVVSQFLFLCCSCVRVYQKRERYEQFFRDEKALKVVKIKAMLGKLLSFRNVHQWCVIADKWASKCKNTKSKYVSYPGGRKHYFGEMCTRASFFPVQRMEFEGRKFSIMADPKEHLTVLYGDYHKIPPKEERLRHTVLEFELEQKENE